MTSQPVSVKPSYVTHPLTDHERMTLAKACEDARLEHGLSLDSLSSALADVAREMSGSLASIVSALGQLIDESSSPGLVVLEKLPNVSDPRRLGLLVGWLLGDVTKYDGEGECVIEIKDQGTKPGERPSFRNSREFFLHTDLSYTNDPPRFFLLHSIANDAAGGGYSEFCKISDALDRMNNLAISQLLAREFEFPAPPHYKGGGVVRLPILSRTSAENPLKIRFRRDSLRTIRRPAIDAVVNLVQALRDSMFETSLPPNSIAVIDNWFLLHGRTAFAPQPEPRHINRIYVNPRKATS